MLNLIEHLIKKDLLTLVRLLFQEMFLVKN